MTPRGLMTRIAATSCTFVLSFAALAFVAGPVAAAEQSTTIQMSLLGGFSPKTVEVPAGTTIVWHNADSVDIPVVRGAHTVTATDGSFDSGEVAPGEGFSKTFVAAASIAYACTIHPQLMSGSITVTAPPANDETSTLPPAQSGESTATGSGTIVQLPSRMNAFAHASAPSGTEVLGERFVSSPFVPPADVAPVLPSPSERVPAADPARQSNVLRVTLMIVATMLIFAATAALAAVRGRSRPRSWQERTPEQNELTEIPHPTRVPLAELKRAKRAPAG